MGKNKVQRTDQAYYVPVNLTCIATTHSTPIILVLTPLTLALVIRTHTVHAGSARTIEYKDRKNTEKCLYTYSARGRRLV